MEVDDTHPMPEPLEVAHLAVHKNPLVGASRPRVNLRQNQNRRQGRRDRFHCSNDVDHGFRFCACLTVSGMTGGGVVDKYRAAIKLAIGATTNTSYLDGDAGGRSRELRIFQNP